MKLVLLWVYLCQFAAYGQNVVLSDELDGVELKEYRASYDSHREKLEKFRISKKTAYRAASFSQKKKILLEVRQRLENDLCEHIFPAWYGTPWDFNGISKTPGEGQIACGYFVSTCLVHVGFNTTP